MPKVVNVFGEVTLINAYLRLLAQRQKNAVQTVHPLGGVVTDGPCWLGPASS
ncbi:MAG: hypothetical protein P8L18_04080 [Verrucomicrobiota bacterium]|nr:hypothetical protein [Verrucomicrobiota bacterium]